MRRDLAIRQTIATVLVLFAVFAIVGHCVGCAPTYTAAQLRCVDKATTLAESKACRRAVDAEYGIAETITKDAGHE
jgi:hypothetical protein